MRTLSRREKFIFTLTILILGYGLGYYGLILPLEEEIGRVHKKVGVEKRGFMIDQRELQKAKMMAPDLQFLTKHFKQKATNEDVFSDLLADIENVAAKLNLSISEMRPLRPQKKENIQYFSVNVMVQCTMEDVLPFLHILQSEPLYFDVHELSIKNKRRRDASALSINLILQKAFF